MTTVNIFEAKTNLSKLVALAEQGHETILARNGKPVARIAPLVPQKKPIRFGLMKGQIWIADDFDAPLPDDILADFEDGPIFPSEKSTQRVAEPVKSATRNDRS
jgi:antitoxin (DNA-binding transcriptional repressor) of toxin-antitoxin stability system